MLQRRVEICGHHVELEHDPAVSESEHKERPPAARPGYRCVGVVVVQTVYLCESSGSAPRLSLFQFPSLVVLLS